MNLRKMFHILAITLSSLAAVVTHGKAQEARVPRKEKKEGDGALARRHRRHHAESKGELASQDPPRHRHAAEDIKNSTHAAEWVSYDEQARVDAPPVHLDPAIMAGAECPAASFAQSTTAPAPLPGDAESRYAWKRQIVTTIFWIGETATQNNPVPNRSSCWDSNWARSYGGNDSPDPAERTPDYAPASFTPGQNPFYVALPYNDMEHGGHKPEAAQVIPWFSREYKGPGRSVCQGRWIAIRYKDRVCYAQWEDAGPFRTDHWQYVFGNERPRPNLNQGAGLDVSPAVRDYLGMNGTDVTDWKFVDFDEVQPGPWGKYGENNTFVQNVRRGGVEVVENAAGKSRGPHHSLIPGFPLPGDEVR